jgi:hypothetical protein
VSEGEKPGEQPREQEFAAIVIAPERLHAFLTDAKIMEATGIRQIRPDGLSSGTGCVVTSPTVHDFFCNDRD